MYILISSCKRDLSWTYIWPLCEYTVQNSSTKVNWNHWTQKPIFNLSKSYKLFNGLLGDRYEAQTIYSQTQFLNNFFIFLLIFSTISFAWNGNIYHHLYITHFISNIHMKYILTFFPFLYLPHPTWSLHFGMWVFNLFSNFTKTKSVVTFVMLQKKG